MGKGVRPVAGYVRRLGLFDAVVVVMGLLEVPVFIWRRRTDGVT
jgi:hypothetical protein